jgi:hypothetical protein
VWALPFLYLAEGSSNVIFDFLVLGLTFSWTLSWLNFFLNSVYKLNWILWSFSWLRLLDLTQLELLIFILLGLDLNRVLYHGISLGSDSFRSPPSTRIDPSYLTWIKLYLFVDSVLHKLEVPCTKMFLTRRKEVSLSCTFLTRFLTRSGNFLPDFLPGRLPRFLPETVSNSLPKSLPRTLLESLPESYQELFPSPTRTRTRSG